MNCKLQAESTGGNWRWNGGAIFRRIHHSVLKTAPCVYFLPRPAPDFIPLCNGALQRHLYAGLSTW